MQGIHHLQTKRCRLGAPVREAQIIWTRVEIGAHWIRVERETRVLDWIKVRGWIEVSCQEIKAQGQWRPSIQPWVQAFWKATIRVHGSCLRTKARCELGAVWVLGRRFLVQGMVLVAGWIKAHVWWVEIKVLEWWAEIRVRVWWVGTKAQDQHLGQVIDQQTKALTGTWSQWIHWNHKLLAATYTRIRICYSRIICFHVRLFKRWLLDPLCSRGLQFRRKYMTRTLWIIRMPIFQSRASISRTLPTSSKGKKVQKRAKADLELLKRVRPGLCPSPNQQST